MKKLGIILVIVLFMSSCYLLRKPVVVDDYVYDTLRAKNFILDGQFIFNGDTIVVQEKE